MVHVTGRLQSIGRAHQSAILFAALTARGAEGPAGEDAVRHARFGYVVRGIPVRLSHATAIDSSKGSDVADHRALRLFLSAKGTNIS